jgi:hypothetical protein
VNATPRECALHSARVFIAEASRRRASPRFHAALLTWAANARRQATELARQREMFGRREEVAA